MTKNKEFEDDGRVISSMDNVDAPYEKLSKRDKNRKKSYDVTKQEKKHMILASYKAYLPAFLCGIIGIGLAILLVMLWLHLF